MSEVRYRSQLRQMLAARDIGSELSVFVESLMESSILISDQLNFILDIETDLELIESVASVVGRLQITDLVPKLIRLFQTIDASTVQIRILESVMFLDHSQTYPFLLSVVKNSQNLDVMRILAVNALQKKHPDIIVPLLAIAQDTSEDPILRGYTISALVYQEDTSILSCLLALLDDAEARVRYDSIRAVGALGDKSLRGYIEPFLLDTTSLNGYIAWAAHSTLERWASQEINQNKSL